MNPIEISENTRLPIEIKDVGSKTIETGESPFSKYLINSMEQVNRSQLEADDAVKKLAVGEQVDIHNTMITLKKAELSLELLMQVRNKIISAYDEIRRMHV